MAPGDQVESERELAAKCGVSPMTARRALGELERLGMVTRRVGAGTFVAPLGSRERRLQDPHEEFGAPECVLVDGGREWRDAKGLVVEERVRLAIEVTLGLRPLLEILGKAVIQAAEEVWAEGDELRIRQTIYGERQVVLAVREMGVRRRRRENWVRR